MDLSLRGIHSGWYDCVCRLVRWKGSISHLYPHSSHSIPMEHRLVGIYRVDSNHWGLRGNIGDTGKHFSRLDSCGTIGHVFLVEQFPVEIRVYVATRLCLFSHDFRHILGGVLTKQTTIP